MITAVRLLLLLFTLALVVGLVILTSSQKSKAIADQLNMGKPVIGYWFQRDGAFSIGQKE